MGLLDLTLDDGVVVLSEKENEQVVVDRYKLYLDMYSKALGLDKKEDNE